MWTTPKGCPLCPTGPKDTTTAPAGIAPANRPSRPRPARWALDPARPAGLLYEGARDIVPGRRDDQARSGRVHIEISTRHGGLGPEQQSYLHDKAEKLLKYFGRLMAIEVAVDHLKHAFVATEEGPTPEAAMDQCVHKIEHQLRRYKERVQHHKGDVTHGDISPRSPEPPEPA